MKYLLFQDFNRPGDQRGFTILFAIILISALSASLVKLSGDSRGKAQSVATVERIMNARTLAVSAINLTLSDLLSNNVPLSNFRENRLQIDDTEVLVRLEDEAFKTDLIAGNTDQISSFIGSVIIDTEYHNALMRRLIEARQQASFHEVVDIWDELRLTGAAYGISTRKNLTIFTRRRSSASQNNVANDEGIANGDQIFAVIAQAHDQRGSMPGVIQYFEKQTDGSFKFLAERQLLMPLTIP